MDKNDILRQSRLDYKKQDLYKNEVEKESSIFSSIATIILATIIFCIQSFLNKGFNFGIYAILTSSGAFSFFIKMIKLRQKKYILLFIIYSVVALFFLFIHIKNLLKN
ncbi:DUF6442 family protein [Lactococcus petauri]|uniref:DUF6442 family protein n=1 Tax=Lactococcus petauri TaxID=1940789 RepID=UPI003853F3E7